MTRAVLAVLLAISVALVALGHTGVAFAGEGDWSGGDAQSIEGAQVTFDEFTYTGEPLTPNPTSVQVGDVELVLGTDYEVGSWANNVNAGEANVTITAIGDQYTGSLKTTFIISPKPIDADDISVAEIETQVYTGSEVTPAVTLTWGDNELVEETDYTLGYASNVEAGTATITVSGSGNFSGTRTIEFEIAKTSIATATVATSNQTYTGEPIKPTPNSVRVNGQPLEFGTDYAISGWTDNTNVGMATMTLTGIGTYTGTKTVKFSIIARPVSDSSVSVASIANQTYTGKAITPAPKVTFGGKTLAKGTDYDLAYSANTNAGTAKVTITGKGNFKGTRTVSFTIAALAISDKSVSVASIANQTYTGKAITPAPKVTFGGKTLAKGTDYTLSYSANTAVGTAKVTITGKGNFKGTRTVSFKIAASSLAKGKVTVSPTFLAYNGKSQAPKITVVVDGRTLKAGTDYTVSPTGATYGTTKVTITGKGNYSGTLTASYRVGFKDCPTSAWYMTEGWIDYVAPKGIMTGTKNSSGAFTGNFEPDGLVTRAQLATILYRYANPNSTATTDPANFGTRSSFKDVPTRQWYTAAVEWCYTWHIITGYKDSSGHETGYFGPEDPITREQLATMVYRFAQAMGASASYNTSTFDSMPDAGKVSGFARSAVGWCLNRGVITGDRSWNPAHINPQGYATRAQTAKIVTVVTRDILGGKRSTTPQGLCVVKFVNEGTTVSTQRLYRGDSITVPATPTRSGYRFSGWGGLPMGDHICTGDATYTAQWTRVSTYGDLYGPIVRGWASNALYGRSDLSSTTSGWHVSYGFADLNADGILELVVHSGSLSSAYSSADRTQVYTIVNERAVLLGNIAGGAVFADIYLSSSYGAVAYEGYSRYMSGSGITYRSGTFKRVSIGSSSASSTILATKSGTVNPDVSSSATYTTSGPYAAIKASVYAKMRTFELWNQTTAKNNLTGLNAISGYQVGAAVSSSTLTTSFSSSALLAQDSDGADGASGEAIDLGELFAEVFDVESEFSLDDLPISEVVDDDVPGDADTGDEGADEAGDAGKSGAGAEEPGDTSESDDTGGAAEGDASDSDANAEDAGGAAEGDGDGDASRDEHAGDSASTDVAETEETPGETSDEASEGAEGAGNGEMGGAGDVTAAGEANAADTLATESDAQGTPNEPGAATEQPEGAAGEGADEGAAGSEPEDASAAVASSGTSVAAGEVAEGEGALAA